jgi:hypothetical protein
VPHQNNEKGAKNNMVRYTIKKMIQPDSTPVMKEGNSFYRVKGDGVILQDFKTKTQANQFIKKRKVSFNKSFRGKK